MTTPEPPQEADDGLRHVRIAGAVGAVVLVVVLAVAVAVVRGGSGDDQSAGTPAPSASSAARPPAAAAASPTAPSSAAPPAAPTPSASSPSAPSGPVVRWRGTVTVNGPSARRDFDAVPPRTSTRDGEPDVWADVLRPLLKAEDGVTLAVMEPGARPDAVRCRDEAAAAGSDRTEQLAEGDVVCLLTSQGRVARLITEDARQTSTSPRLTFAVVVWDMPAGGGR